jgi:hypothetical protein
VNHLAFHAGPCSAVDRLVADADHNGVASALRRPTSFAGAPQDYAAHLEDDDGFEIELVGHNLNDLS